MRFQKNFASRCRRAVVDGEVVQLLAREAVEPVVLVGHVRTVRHDGGHARRRGGARLAGRRRGRRHLHARDDLVLRGRPDGRVRRRHGAGRRDAASAAAVRSIASARATCAPGIRRRATRGARGARRAGRRASSCSSCPSVRGSSASPRARPATRASRRRACATRGSRGASSSSTRRSSEPAWRLERDTLLQEWLRALRGARRGGRGAAAAARRDPALRRACELLGDELAAQRHARRASPRAAGVSRHRLTRLFRAAYGLPPHRFVLAQRIRAARRLLERGAAPAEVARRPASSTRATCTATSRARSG